jgi:protein-ribulosamine 3-kinase
MTGPIGREMAKGEHEGTKAIHAVIPKNMPRALAHGTYVKDNNRHFVLNEFHEMDDEMPAPLQFVSVIAELHQKSVSPTGKFGFHCTTHAGTTPVLNDWCESWEEFFARSLRETMKWETSVQGQDDEMDRLEQDTLEKVVPRLLRPLQTGGRSIKPSLCHGDLWHGNVGVDRVTNEPILYDPCALYGHNECNFNHFHYTVCPWFGFWS